MELQSDAGTSTARCVLRERSQGRLAAGTSRAVGDRPAVPLPMSWQLSCGTLCMGMALGLQLGTAGLRGAEASERTNLPPVLPPLDFFENKKPQPDLLLKDKREGRYTTGFPIIGWDPETEFNYGAALQWFDNGSADSPFFRYTPYRQRVAVAVRGSTGGSATAGIYYDHPYVADSPWRIRALALFDRNKFENYFGIGESTLGPLTYPGSTQEYDTIAEYKKALYQVVNTNQIWGLYNNYLRREGMGGLAVERDYLGGLLRPLLGLEFSHIGVDDYTGEQLDDAVMQETRLRSDYLAGRIRGFDGGYDNAVKIGLTYDTRDFEPDPSSGVVLQMVGRVSTTVLGSSFDYQQLTLSGRGFYNLLPSPKRLVVAGRLTYTMQFGDVPFYSAPTIPFTDGDVTGLGGYETMRGFVVNRFVGDAAAYANAELRWTFGEAMLWKQHLRFMLAPFVDTGRVFDSVGDTTLHGWKFDGGLGFRLAWNLATVVCFDYARSSEGTMFYMQLGHQF